MSDTINLHDVKVQNIDNRITDTIYIDTSNNKGLNIKASKQYVLGSKSYSEAEPIYNGSGQEIQLRIPTNGQTLSTTNSKLKYNMKFVFRLPVNKVNWYGKYVLQGMAWWFIPCITQTYNIDQVEKIRVIEETDKKFYICSSCGGSYGIFQSSQLVYGTLNQKDELLHIRNNLIQSQLTQEFVNGMNQQFFDTTNRIIEIEHMPYKYDKTTKSKKYAKVYYNAQGEKVVEEDPWQSADIFQQNNAGNDIEQLEYTQYGILNHTIYHQFSCQLALINQIFDADDSVFYMQALQNTDVVLTLKLLPYYMSEIFACSTLLDYKKTGITEFYLQLYSNNSDDIQGLIMQKDKQVVPYLRYVQSIQTVNDPNVPVNDQLVQGFTSLSNAYFILYRQDEGQTVQDKYNQYGAIQKESNYIHGRMTLFSPDQLYQIYNNFTDQNQSFVFFNNFQVNRGSTSNQLFSEKLISMDDMLNETLRSMNFNNNKTEGLLECWHDMLHLVMKYAYIRVCFDNSSLTDGPSEVKYDGYDSQINKINYTYNLSYYNFAYGMNNQVLYVASNVPQKCQIKDNVYALMSIQNYDQVLITNIKNHTITVSEKPVGQMAQ